MVIGLVLFALFLVLPVPGANGDVRAMLAVAALMATFWVSEAIPLAATSLLPLVLFPTLGLASAAEAAAPYANHLIFLFMGGFMLAQAMQRWGLHRRLALRIIAAVGTSPPRVVLGFMCATGFLSMWVSNTATAAMMMPIAVAVAAQFASESEEANAPRSNFGACLMLGIAYAASIGGMGTLIGTPPNVMLAGTLERSYGIQLSFLSWMAFAVPLVALFIPLTWLTLTRFVFPLSTHDVGTGRAVIAARLEGLGPMTRGERSTAWVFAVTAFAWMTRPVWADWLAHGALIADSTTAIACAVALFSIPAGTGERLLDWEWASRIPWDVLLLFGGGFSLAAGFDRSGLASWVGDRLELFHTAPLALFVVVVVFALTLLTEFASNTASAAMALPVLGAAALAIGVSPLLLCVPAAVAASCAFMLPAATPPNAILFGTGAFTIPQMIRAGFWIDILGTVLISTFALLVLPLLF
jgi:sodium-dependent dicarboxylate transporter 2/3/5